MSLGYAQMGAKVLINDRWYKPAQTRQPANSGYTTPCSTTHRQGGLAKRPHCSRGLVLTLPICQWRQTGSFSSKISVAPLSMFIKPLKQAINWTRLSCKDMAQNEVRLQLHALGYNLGVFLHGTDLAEDVRRLVADQPPNTTDQKPARGSSATPATLRASLPMIAGSAEICSTASLPLFKGYARQLVPTISVSAAKAEENRLGWHLRNLPLMQAFSCVNTSRSLIRNLAMKPNPQHSDAEGT